MTETSNPNPEEPGGDFAKTGVSKDEAGPGTFPAQGTLAFQMILGRQHMLRFITGPILAASLALSGASLAQTAGSTGGAGGAGAAGGPGTASGANAAAAASQGVGGGSSPNAAGAVSTGAPNAAPGANPNQVPSTVGIAPKPTASSTYAPATGGGGSASRSTEGRATEQNQIVEDDREVSRRIKSICKGC